jgi:hypothetical protein
LLTLYVQTTLHLESRFLRRETRGFSRAQTGDALTSAVPLAWSISMLMHASVHSFNFDDNTAGAVLSFNVLAYQWGWNYYFPSDLVKLFRDGPRRVGHNSVEVFSSGEPYSQLLTRYRYEHARRLALQGGFVSRALPLLSPLALFAQSPSFDVPFEPALFAPVGPDLSRPLVSNADSDGVVSVLGDAENVNASFFSVYAGFSTSPLFRLFSRPVNSFLALGMGGILGACFNGEGARTGPALDTVFMATQENPAACFLPARSLPSLSLGGNKFFLIHRHLAGARSEQGGGAASPILGSALNIDPLQTALETTLPLGY